MVVLETRPSLLSEFFKRSTFFGYHALPKKDNLHFEFKSMPVPMHPGSRDLSKGNISSLRVERKEITFHSASLEMDRIDSSETKGSSGQL